jgi:hypothetical protein
MMNPLQFCSKWDTKDGHISTDASRGQLAENLWEGKKFWIEIVRKNETLLCSVNISAMSYSSVHLLLLWLYSPCGPWPLFQFTNLYTVGRNPWTGDQPVARPLPTHKTTQTQNKRIHRHPCLNWDSSPRSQRSNERRQFMPQTARPLWTLL